MIGEILDGIVNDDPVLLAYDIASFERELSFVSVIEWVGRQDYLCVFLSQEFHDGYRVAECISSLQPNDAC